MNIHILSNSPTRINSGFGIVCRNLALGLSRIGHNISISNMQGIYNVEYWNGIVVYPLNSVSGASGNSFYTSEIQQFVRNLKDSKAECVIFIYPCYDDVSVLNRLHEVHPNTVWYFVVEGENLPKGWINEAKKVKKVIPMTEQGAHELRKGGLINDRNLEKEIYHGYDPNVFKQIKQINNNGCKIESNYCKWSEEKYQLIGDRTELCERGCFKCSGDEEDSCKWYELEKVCLNFPDGGEELVGDSEKLGKIKDTFGVDCIFGFTGDNNGKRKRIDLLLKSYMSLDRKIKKDTMLLLHTLPGLNNSLNGDGRDGYNLFDIIRKWEEKHGSGSSGKIGFIYGYDGSPNGWSDRLLNIFYNTIDINVSCSSGESFCLPCLESMAVGKAQIAPKFSSFIELIGIGNNNGGEGERGLLARLDGYEILSNGVRRGVVSVKNMADCMELLYNDKGLRSSLGDRGSEWAKQYIWDNICNKFDEVLRVNMK